MLWSSASGSGLIKLVMTVIPSRSKLLSSDIVVVCEGVGERGKLVRGTICEIRSCQETRVDLSEKPTPNNQLSFPPPIYLYLPDRTLNYSARLIFILGDARIRVGDNLLIPH